MVQKIVFLSNVIMVAIIILAAVVGAVIFYLLKVKKIRAVEEKIDYSKFDRTHSEEYVKFDDVVSLDGLRDLKSGGMLVIDKHTFVAAIAVYGYNFDTASDSERRRTMVGSVGFFRNVDAPIQMRQHVTAEDMSFSIDEFTCILKQLTFELMSLNEEFEQTKSLGEDAIDDVEELEKINERLSELERQIVAVGYQRNEAARMIAYMQDASVGVTDRENHVIFSYHFNPDEHTEELTEQEIRVEAANKILTKARIYGGCLDACGCNYKLLSGEELLDVYRHHTHPYGANEMNIRTLLNAADSALFVTSNDLVRLTMSMKGEEQYREAMEQLEVAEEEKVQIAIMDSARYMTRILEQAEEEVAKEIKKVG